MIAAAPDMLAALYKAQVALCDAYSPRDRAALAAVNAAIDKATGEGNQRMTHSPTHDRTYWRAERAVRLIEAGKASGHELAIALAERLEDERARRKALEDEG